LQRLAFMVSYHGGRIALAADQQAAALALLPAGTRDWALGMTYYSDILDTLGRSAEAEASAAESYDYGRRVGDPVSIGYGAWSLAIVHAHRNDHAATLHWLEEVERSPGNWVAEVQGREFLAFGSDLLAGLGDQAGAAAYRARCAERIADEGTQDLLDVLDGRLEAMFGDPQRAIELFERLDGEPYATIRTKWVRMLFRALAAMRLGNRHEATRFVGRSLEIVEGMGLPDLPYRHEPTLVAMLADVWPGGPQVTETSARVVTLGGFGVVRGAEIMTPAPGHPATLVKLLALRGAMTSEQVIDQLWPDTDVTTGRARLRNLLNRVRGQSGDLVGRSGEVLELLPEVTVDIGRFEQLVEAALAGGEHERPGLARVAMAAYGGELLPGDAYEDWAAGPRERLRRRYLSLVDIVAADALGRGDLDEAMRLLDMAIEHEPLEESRYARAAAALLAGGRRAAAREMLDRATGALDEIGVSPGPELLAIGRSLDVRG
jgi:DNA-binding SARP family transcriptional activator